MRVNQLSVQPNQMQLDGQKDCNKESQADQQANPLSISSQDSFNGSNGLNMAQVFDAAQGSEINDIISGLIELGASASGGAQPNAPIQADAAQEAGEAEGVQNDSQNNPIAALLQLLLILLQNLQAQADQTAQQEQAQQPAQQASSDPLSAMLSMLTGMGAGGGPMSAGQSGVNGISSSGGRVQASANDGEAINSRGNAQLQNSLDKIENDPVGSVLLAKARENGVKIRVGDTGGSNILGLFNPNTNEIVVRDPNNIKTIVHELGHAATPQDGNSQEEEGIVEAIGRDVVSRIETGRSLSNNELQQIANQKRTLYRELNRSNDIKNSLANLGISVGIT